jgi:hypothetical protein
VSPVQRPSREPDNDGGASFLRGFPPDIAVTRKFADDLGEHELLVSQQASVTLTNGVSFDIDGFQVVDEKRLSGIDDATKAIGIAGAGSR